MKLNKTNIILLLAIINVATLGWGYMDFYHQDQLIEQCNDHWVQNFRTYCPTVDIAYGGVPMFDLNLSVDETQDTNKDS